MAENEDKRVEQQNADVVPVFGGLYTDTTEINQPQGTQRFVLNGLRETVDKNINIITNDYSNQEVRNFPLGNDGKEYLLGSCYVGDNNFVVFTLSYREDSTNNFRHISKIYLFNTITEDSELLLSDENTVNESDRLNFNEHNQIQSVFRTFNGCDRVVYFTDNFNPPRRLNIDKIYDYIDGSEDKAISDKLRLIKNYNKIPEFGRIVDGQFGDTIVHGIEVLSGGKLLPGGYQIGIRLVDSNFNPTNWITISNTVVITNEEPQSYNEMRGSTTKKTDWQNFGETNKLIKASVLSDTVDDNYSYIQLCLIKINSGDGSISGVDVSPFISIMNDENKPKQYSYQFTGTVEYDKTSVEELALETINIDKVKILKIQDDRLLMGNVSEKQVDWCKLQKYASQIAMCVELKKITYDNLDNIDNPASPLNNFGKRGYMPGEIYSFGIVYIFDDGTKSPVYHIPGMTSEDVDLQALAPGDELKYFPSDYTNNECEDVRYQDRNNCDKTSEWGLDFKGNELLGKKIRHHRFPTRHKLNKSIIQDKEPSCEKIEIGSSSSILEVNIKDSYINSCKRGIIKNVTTDYYVKIPYSEITRHYRRHHATFTVKIKFGCYNSSTENIEWKDILFHDIDVKEWETKVKKDGFYCINLGTFPYRPFIEYIAEEVAQYSWSSGDKGTRYGWETTAGRIRSKYKIDRGGQGREDDAFIVDDTATGYPSDIATDWELLKWFFYPFKNYNNTSHNVKVDTPKFSNVKTKAENFYFHFSQDSLYREERYVNFSVVNRINEKKRRNIGSITDYNLVCYPDWTIHPIDDVEYKCNNFNNIENYILGAHFWNIKIPSLKDTNGNKIVGYYIVRNERDSENKTILDSFVTMPVTSTKKTDSFTVGFTTADSNITKESEISDSSISFISPEMKYLHKDFENVEFVVEGYMYKPKLFDREVCVQHANTNSAYQLYSSCNYQNNKLSTNNTRFIVEDVQDGSSYNKKINKKTEYDDDGFDFLGIVRENMLVTIQLGDALIIKPKNLKYLSPLDDYSFFVQENGVKKVKTVYNLSSDNKYGFIYFGDTDEIEIESGADWGTERKKKIVDCLIRYAYGYIRKTSVPNPYGLFMGLPYYCDSLKVEHIDYDIEYLTQTTVFNGDVYTTPMKHWNSIYYDTRVRKRERKSGIAKIVLGAIGTVASVVGGIVGGIFTGGAAIGPALAAAKVSFSIMMSGVKIEKANILSRILASKNLSPSISNKWTDFFLKNANQDDDQIQWFYEILNCLWFESTVNQFWRVGTSKDMPDFLSPLTFYDSSMYETYIKNKMFIVDENRKDGLLYQGFAASEYYEINPDYHRLNNLKSYYTLPLQYDCCSKCLQRFPFRVVYSEKSFPEEVVDNYTKFLANNYRDFPGNSGEIINIFSSNKALYVQTEEGLYNITTTAQELETTDSSIVFLGSGAFLSQPILPLISELGGNYGTKYLFGSLDNNVGYFFINEESNSLYHIPITKNNYGTVSFGSPVPITMVGLFNMSKELFKNYIDEQYQNSYNEHYPHLDNTSSEFGSGYVLVFDNRNKRLIVTKKDFIVEPIAGNTLPMFKVFNGKLYDIETLNSPGNDYEFIEIKDNKAIYGKYVTTFVPGGSTRVELVRPFVKGFNTITFKYIIFSYLDKDGNTLEVVDLESKGINVRNTHNISYNIEGVDNENNKVSSISVLPEQSSILDDDVIREYNTITFNNILEILNNVFSNNIGLLSGYDIIFEEIKDGCDITYYVKVIVKTDIEEKETQEDLCSLVLHKTFIPESGSSHNPTVEEVLDLQKENPKLTITVTGGQVLELNVVLNNYYYDGNNNPHFEYITDEFSCDLLEGLSITAIDESSLFDNNNNQFVIESFSVQGSEIHVTNKVFDNDPPQIEYRWDFLEYVCIGFNKYSREEKFVSVDGGVSWTSTGETRDTLIEQNSTDCGYSCTEELIINLRITNGARCYSEQDFINNHLNGIDGHECCLFENTIYSDYVLIQDGDDYIVQIKIDGAPCGIGFCQFSDIDTDCFLANVFQNPNTYSVDDMYGEETPECDTFNVIVHDISFDDKDVIKVIKDVILDNSYDAEYVLEDYFFQEGFLQTPNSGEVPTNLLRYEQRDNYQIRFEFSMILDTHFSQQDWDDFINGLRDNFPHSVWEFEQRFFNLQRFADPSNFFFNMYYDESTKTLTIVNSENSVYTSNTRSLRKSNGGNLQCEDDQEAEYRFVSIDGINIGYETVEVPLNEISRGNYTVKDLSWTLSYNILTKTWQSFHSYLPNNYISGNDNFYSYLLGTRGLWKHNVLGSFGSYYGNIYDFIIDYVSVAQAGLRTNIWDSVQIVATVQKFDANTNSYYDVDEVFFDKAVFSNNKQCSGEKLLTLKNNNINENYLLQQVENTDNILVDRNERVWSLNNIRDIVDKNVKEPIWIREKGSPIESLNSNIFTSNIEWFENNEIFRDNFLKIKLFFSNFANGNNDYRILVYFLINNNKPSIR